MDLSALIERLENATAPDREIGSPKKYAATAALALCLAALRATRSASAPADAVTGQGET